MWWYMHTMKYYLAIKKEWNNAICNNMDGPRDCHMWSMSERDKYHMILLVNWILKRYRWTYLQNRNKPTDIENKLMVTKGDRGGGGVN